MNKEEIIKELDKQNRELGEELSLTKDRLNKEKFEKDHYKHLYSEVKKQKDDVVDYIKNHIQEYDVDGSPTNLDEFDFLASPKILLRMLGEIDD